MALAISAPMMIAIIVGAIIILSVLIILLVKLLKNKKPKIKVDENFINELIANYGGKENIKSVSVEHARLKIEVEDLELAYRDVAKILEDI